MVVLLSSGSLKFPISGPESISDFAEPTRSILQAAYDRGDYENIPDPEPVDLPPVPNWQAWQLALLTNPGVQAVFQQVPTLLTSALTTLIGQVSDKPDTVTTIAAIWQQIAPGMPQQVRDAIKLAAEANNLPADFVAII